VSAGNVSRLHSDQATRVARKVRLRLVQTHLRVSDRRWRSHELTAAPFSIIDLSIDITDVGDSDCGIGYERITRVFIFLKLPVVLCSMRVVVSLSRE